MASISMDSGSALSNSYINNTILNGISAQESKLKETMASMASKGDGAMNSYDMLQMQQQVQQWSIMVDIQGTITKQLADSLKSVVQKSA